MKVLTRVPALRTLLAPGFDLRLAGEPSAIEWAIARPVDLSKSHGVDLTLERLQEIADSYDPAIEAAAVNFDHTYEGPAHAWVESLELRDGILWARPIELSDELTEGIERGRYRRCSMEFTTAHTETGGWYLHGLAVLGSRRPGIKGLPPIRLSAPRYVLDLSDPGPAGQPASHEAPEEVIMTTPATQQQPAAGAPTATTTTQPPATPPAAPAAPPAGGGQAAVDAELSAVRTARQEVELEARTVRRQRVELDVDRLLDGQLAKKVTPAQRRAGARELLVELRAAAHPLEVTLAAADGKTTKASAYDALVAVLAAQPDVGVIGAGEIATTDDAAAVALDDRSEEERATHRRMGLSDEDAAKLRARQKRSA